uniref:Uncharacterized protein n=1 Tax=Promethearchaeum syntrophicum TaxID=2594042 RepID=A0A5B9D790_9ARCH|nr:hypothetical protein DSAG12_00524 [Candidatus Prometheoarchaeum syntrophicum]
MMDSKPIFLFGTKDQIDKIQKLKRLRKNNACEGIRTHESKNSLDLKSSAVLANPADLAIFRPLGYTCLDSLYNKSMISKKFFFFNVKYYFVCSAHHLSLHSREQNLCSGGSWQMFLWII